MKAQLKQLGLTSCLRLSSIVLQTALIMVVGRIVGPSGVGALQVFLAWTCSLGDTVSAGLTTHAMRQLAKTERDQAGVFLAEAAKRMSFVWLVIVFFAVFAWQQGLIESKLELVLIALSIFCFALYRIASEGLKAFRDVDFSVFVESGFPPLVAMVLILSAHLLGFETTVVSVLCAFTSGYFVTAAVLLFRFTRFIGGLKHYRGEAVTIAWGDHTPFWVSAMISIAFLNYPFFVLPHFVALDEVGAFALAFKLINISTTILLLLNAIYGPRFSRAADLGDFAGAARLLQTTRQLSMLAYVPLAILLVFAFPYVHPWFGDGFSTGFDFLLVLVVGQLFNAATGLSGQFLNMAGAGSIEMKVQIFGLAVALLLTPLAGALTGAMGIAGVYSVSLAIRSIGSMYFAHRLLTPQSTLAYQT